MKETYITNIFLDSVATTRKFTTIRDFERTLSQLGLSNEPKFWGWDGYRGVDASAERFLSEAFSEAFDFLANTAPDLKIIVLCKPVSVLGESFLESVLKVISRALPGFSGKVEIVEGYDCVGIIRSVEVVKHAIQHAGGTGLVLSAEKLQDEALRFGKYSIFSDYALSLVVSTVPAERCFHVQDVAIVKDETTAASLDNIAIRESESECFSELICRNGLSVSDVDKVFYLNLYLPIAHMKLSSIGVDEDQYSGCLHHELGHCFGADPFLNMLREKAADPSGVDVLLASGRGVAGSLLISRTGPKRGPLS